jgi:SAM-dependent methyltransferase
MANKSNNSFWNREYRNAIHLTLSDNPSEDLMKFCRFVERQEGRKMINPISLSVDLGCGNGRNSIYLAELFDCRGFGLDISGEAIRQARAVAEARGFDKLSFAIGSISNPLPLPDRCATLVLDMMASHVLKAGERERLRDEIIRILRPGGWLFFKSFLRDEDSHAERMLREHPSDEPDGYIHPTLKVFEHVWTEETARAFFEPYFSIEKIEKSHKHIIHGQPGKRRTISMYMKRI